MNDLPLPERLRALHEDIGITRLADITGLDTLGVPVFSAIRPASRSLSVMSGRGTTPERARIAATMEAIEAHAAENYRPECIRARYREITGEAVDPRTLPHAPGAQADGELWWCPATGLLSGTKFLVPFEAVHTDWTRPPHPSGLALDSSGIGAALEHDLAVRHGLLELIERDALAMSAATAIASGQQLPVLTPALAAPGAGPEAALLAAQLESAGAHVHLTCLRSDTGIPAIAAYVLDTTPNPFRCLPVAMGTAAAPGAGEAAVRAITEAAQSRLVTISGARDDLVPAEYDRMTDPGAGQRFRARLADAGPPGPPPAARDGSVKSLAAAIQAVTGHEPVVVSLARYPLSPGTVHVVRVLAPGLEGPGAQLGVTTAPGPRAAAMLREAG